LSELLVIGTGKSVLQYQDQLHDVGMPILAWGDSSYLLHNNCILPEYYGFLDPFCATNYLRMADSKATQICVFHPMHSSDYSTMLEYIGTPDIYNVNTVRFRQYIETLPTCNPNFFPTTTVQKLNKEEDALAKELDGAQAGRRFRDRVIIGSNPNPLGVAFKQRFMDLEENRLTMAILPLVYHLGYKTIYLLGFDGRGGRFHKKNVPLKDIHKKSYDRYLPRWLEWKKYHGMDIYLATPPELSYLSKYLKSKNIL